MVSREPGGENAALEAVFDEHGHPAGVVDVGVGDEHIVDAARGKGQGAVVHLVPALLQSAVDEDALAAYLQTMAAAGDALVSAEKLSFMAFVLSSQKLGCPYCNTFSSRRQQELHFAGTSVIIGGNITCYSPEEEH